MTSRPALPDLDLPAYQRAARLLLTHRVLTAAWPDPDALPLVRRFAADLDRDLDALAGLRLVTTPGGARLVGPADHLDPFAGPDLDRRRYALLALALAVLERSGLQVTLSDLSARLRPAAEAIAGLGFDPDRHAHRRDFCVAVEWLVTRGALRLTDGSLEGWRRGDPDGEALYDIDRDICRLLFHPPAALHELGTAARLLTAPPADDAARDTRRLATRQRLVRALLEQPALYLDDLTDLERRHLQTEAAEIARDVERLTGAHVERRREGLALIDPGARHAGPRFPQGGSDVQCALLLGDCILRFVSGDDAREQVRVPTRAELTQSLVRELDEALPTRALDPDAALDRAPPDAQATLPLVPAAFLAAEAERLRVEYAAHLRADLQGDAAALLAAALRVLTEFDLVRPVPGGLVAMPALARYREVAVRRAAAPLLDLLDAR